MESAAPEDAHRLEKEHRLAAILSHVEARQVKNDYTFQLEAQRYQIQRASVGTGLRGASVRVEQRLDGTVAARFRERYLEIGAVAEARPAAPPMRPASSRPRSRNGQSTWMKKFSLRGGPSLEQAIAASNATSQTQFPSEAPGKSSPARRRVS